MDYADAAAQLKGLIEEASQGIEYAENALETAGAVHTEALIASLSAFNQAVRIVQSTSGAASAQRVTKSGATLQPMPEKTAEFRLDFPITAEQFAILQKGEAPVDDFDRWHLESDGMHLRYYRNATGYCFFDATVEPAGDAFVVGDVVVNQDDKQYSETSMGVCAAQLKILLANNLGLDDEPYWDEMDAASDE